MPHLEDVASLKGTKTEAKILFFWKNVGTVMAMIDLILLMSIIIMPITTIK